MRTLRRYRFGYSISAILILIGLASITVTIWKAWSQLSSSNEPLNTLWTFIWTEEVDTGLGIQFKTIYLIILAAAAFVAASFMLAFSRQWLFLPSEVKNLQCPFCKKYWRSTYDRGQMLCPHCRHLIHPKLVG